MKKDLNKKEIQLDKFFNKFKTPGEFYSATKKSIMRDTATNHEEITEYLGVILELVFTVGKLIIQKIEERERK